VIPIPAAASRKVGTIADMGDEVSVAMSLPLDSDGFLRRECPTCEREFKWLSAEEGSADAAPIPDGGYFCPYCAIQAQPDAWWTPAQLEAINSVMSSEIVDPALKKFERDLRRSAKRSGGFLDVSVRHEPAHQPAPLVEVDDMRRVDFLCHPGEPIKILDDWTQPVHCLICGSEAKA
jgi:hypothetical protein